MINFLFPLPRGFPNVPKNTQSGSFASGSTTQVAYHNGDEYVIKIYRGCNMGLNKNRTFRYVRYLPFAAGMIQSPGGIHGLIFANKRLQSPEFVSRLPDSSNI